VADAHFSGGLTQAGDVALLSDLPLKVCQKISLSVRQWRSLGHFDRIPFYGRTIQDLDAECQTKCKIKRKKIFYIGQADHFEKNGYISTNYKMRSRKWQGVSKIL
jgi:hypothetical protein